MEQGGSIFKEFKREAFSFAQEMRSADFGDQRLTDRLILTLDQLYKYPSLPMTGACEDNAQVKAAYRLINNKRVSIEQIILPHQENTIFRMNSHARVFAVHDTTTLNYATHLSTEGLGQIGRGGGASGRGLFLHTTEIFSSLGLPLGILHQTL